MRSNINQLVEKYLSQMNLDEKLAQLCSFWIYDLQTNGELDPQKVALNLKDGVGQITRVGGASTLDPVNIARTANQIQKFLIENTRLGIPAIMHEECCLGAMMLGGSAYPQMIGLASTFQPQLAEKMTSEIKQQLRAVGVHQGLAPVLDIARDARWGRVEETFGEDPLLASQMGIHYVRGLQGDDLKTGVMATAKHFVGHSFSEGGLNCAPVHLSINELWNVYLMPFQAVIHKAGVASVMNAYPELNGQVVAASRDILTHLLRNALHFDGLIVSDYQAISMLHHYHNAAPDYTTAAAMALMAGIEVELPTRCCYGEHLKIALEKGLVTLDQVDEAVRRHLQKKYELGLFENPFVDESRVIEVFETRTQRALAREIAVKSLILLSNDGTLPLEKTLKTLAVIGPNANSSRNLLGDYSYAAVAELLSHTQPPDSCFYKADTSFINHGQINIPTILDAIRAKVPNTKVLYAKGCDIHSPSRDGFHEALKAAERADIVVLVLGDKSGLTPDCTCGEFRDNADLKLPGVQSELAQAVFSLNKPTVVVLINGRPLAIPDIAEKASAIIEAWLPGEEGGVAIADALFGDVNPGGKVPMSFPRSVGQVPLFYNHKPAGGKSYLYNDYVAESTQPLYPFGHGLSYTSFDYKNLSIEPKQAAQGEFVFISLFVHNNGKYVGDEVVQLYIRDIYANPPRPIKELKGFCRLTLAPGESKYITFRLPVDMLAYYDENLDFVVEAGEIEVMLGSSSDDIRLNGSFEIVGQQKTKIKERIFSCPVEIH